MAYGKVSETYWHDEKIRALSEENARLRRRVALLVGATSGTATNGRARAAPATNWTTKKNRLIRKAVFEAGNFTCQGCGAKADPPPDYDGRYTLRCTGGCGLDYNHFHVDHIVPKALGGTDDPENLMTLCQSCNSRKQARTWRPRAKA